MNFKKLLALVGGVILSTGAWAQTDVTSTYIINPGFESCTARTSNLAAGASAAGDDYESAGWKLAQQSAWSSSAVVAYGGSGQVNGASAPSTDNAGNTGNALGVSVGWGGTNKYQSTTAITLPAGHYELKVYAYNKLSGKTQFKSVFGFVPTSGTSYLSTKTSFKYGTWETDVVTFDLSEPTEGKFQIGGTAVSGGSGDNAKVFFDNITLIQTPFATSSDYDALNNAISTAKTITIGFDAGEYAPYNVIPDLTVAQTIDQTANNFQTTVQAATKALNDIVANTDEVNAIFDGDFECDYSGQTGNVQPMGWYREKGKTGDGYNVRYVTGNAGLAAVGGHGLFTKMNAYYGWGDGYTMPLKANTYYTVSFKAGGWGDCDDMTDYLKILNPTGNEIAKETFTVPGKNADSDATENNWTTVTETFKTDAAGNYVLGLVPRNSGKKTQNQFVYGNFKLVRATVDEIKHLLLKEIAAAKDVYNNGANVGTGVFQLPESAGNAFNTAISITAQGVYDNSNATVDEVAAAIDALLDAEESYSATELNKPTEGMRYYLKVATSGHAKEGNAVVVDLGDTSDSNQTGYTFKANASPSAHVAGAYIFTQVEGNTYYISVVRPEGTVYLTYGNKNNSTADWADSQIQATSEEEMKGTFKIAATSIANVFNIYNTNTNKTIACQTGGNIYTEEGNADFSLAEASQASVSVDIAAGKYATRIFPFTPTIPDVVTVYSCEAVAGSELALEEVTAPEANKPYILYSEKGYNGDALTGWGTAVADSYNAGLLTGVYTEAAVPANSYVLQTQDGKQVFYLVGGEETFTATPYRAYLTVAERGVKAFYLDQADGITRVVEACEMENATIYNLAGQRVQKAVKGLYIINGKKVMVK